MAGMYNPPYVTRLVEGCQSDECYQGIFPDIWHVLQKNMNFTYTHEKRKEVAWGVFVNGTWIGIVGRDLKT